VSCKQFSNKQATPTLRFLAQSEVLFCVVKLAIAVSSKGCGLVVGTLKKKKAQSSAESMQREGKKI